MADNAGSRIAVSITHEPLAFLYGLFTPTVEINGRHERRKWGNHSFEAAPGEYAVSVSYPWIFAPECGKNTVRFTLAPGESKHVHYRAGLVRYLPGKITVS